MKFEDQLAAIKTKDDLHKWVDALADNAQGVILTMRTEEDGNVIYSYRNIGDTTVERTHYLAASYSHWLFAYPSDD
jgi:hypothetical protein